MTTPGEASSATLVAVMRDGRARDDWRASERTCRGVQGASSSAPAYGRRKDDRRGRASATHLVEDLLVDGLSPRLLQPPIRLLPIRPWPVIGPMRDPRDAPVDRAAVDRRPLEHDAQALARPGGVDEQAGRGG